MSALVMVLAAAATASAAEFVVTTTADGNDGSCNSHCTLREALAAASAAGTADSITVPAGTFVLNQGGELSLSGDAINGAGARATVIDAGGDSRVLSTSSVGQANPSISGVTVRGGNASGQAAPGQGGGILIAFGSLTISNSHVSANTAAQGGGIAASSGDNLFMTGSTVAGNIAMSGSGAAGGGIWGANENLLVLINSTVTGNAARNPGPTAALGGGIYAGGGTTTGLSNVTLAGNEASSGSGGGIYLVSGQFAVWTNTIIADNTGGGCAGEVAAIPATSRNNLVTDGTCTLTGPGNLQGLSAQIGSLANNGGPTDTRALAPTSPAINGGSGCAATDQRGIARPQQAACDIGAFEYVFPILTVVTQVINDDGGTRGPGDFSVHVRAGADVAGSPQPGSATGTSYTLAGGSYTVSADAVTRYSVTIAGDCGPDGSVTLSENQSRICTVTADDQPLPPTLPPPTLRKTVNVVPKSGIVRVKRPGKKRFVRLTEGQQIPVGSIIDTRKGRVTLTVAADSKGKTATADFYAGIFKVTQTKGARPITNLELTEKLSCPTAGKANAAARTRRRRLWGDGSGRFRTQGEYSSATVRGTKWLVEDRCASTLTRVVRGKVAVRDFVKRKTVILRAGKRYVAKAR